MLVSILKYNQRPFEKLAVEIFVVKEKPNQVLLSYQLYKQHLSLADIHGWNHSFQLVKSDQLALKVAVQDQVKNQLVSVLLLFLGADQTFFGEIRQVFQKLDHFFGLFGQKKLLLRVHRFHQNQRLLFYGPG